MIGGETQRSTDVLAAVPEAEEEGEAFEMEAYGEEEDELESPTLDKSTAALLKDATIRRGTMPSPTESVVGKDPDRWVLSDIYRQKVQEVQVSILFVAVVLNVTHLAFQTVYFNCLFCMTPSISVSTALC